MPIIPMWPPTDFRYIYNASFLFWIGETFELKAELNADTRDRRKEAVKKVIANMTIGKDVSMLFADVVKNMQTEDLELKKLVYLYLINYAKSQPELVILAVNTFVKDSDDPNPLIRALAIRTMGCLRVPKIVDYICPPLQKGLKDTHPYVRKTAVICVAKLYDLNPSLARDNGFIAAVQDLLSDSNPMVVANSVAALLEIRKNSKEIFNFNAGTLNKLSAAMNDSTEWGQISILEALAAHTPSDTKEADLIVERVIPRLQHINPSVVLSAVKVLIVYREYCSPEASEQLERKLAPSLVSLMSTPAEIQYVALRNIYLILQKYPFILQNEVRVFFCKYTDPLYIKLEKLRIIVKLANDRNIDQVISELKEYANEVDVEFVRRSINALGECAIAIESAAERCVNGLLELIKNKVNYIVQESVVVIKDIFRKYPNRYESVIPVLCENMDLLDESESKASMIWIIGEYAHKIENSVELLTDFIENFKTETVQVQLQILTATVKLFLKKPQEGQQLVQSLLQTTSQTGESADLRDKAFVYWRLLSSDPQAAKTVLLSEKPPIKEESSIVASILNELIKELGLISSVYHKPASTFLSANQSEFVVGENGDEEAYEDEIVTGQIGDLLDLDAAPAAPSSSGVSPSPNGAAVDLISGSPPKPSNLTGAPLELAGGASAAFDLPLPHQLFLSAQQAKGLELSGTFARQNGFPVMELVFTNKSQLPMNEFAVQFNKNSFGLVPMNQPSAVVLAPNQSGRFRVSMATNGPVSKMQPLNLLQIAIKNNVDVFYFQTKLPVHVLFAEPPQVPAMALDTESRTILDNNQVPVLKFNFPVPGNKPELAGHRLRDMLRFFNLNAVEEQQRLPFSAKLVSGTGSLNIVGQIDYHQMSRIYEITLKSPVAEVLPSAQESVQVILNAIFSQP